MTPNKKREPRILNILDHIDPASCYTAGDLSIMLGLHVSSITRLFERYSLFGNIAFCERPNGGIVPMKLYFGHEIIKAFKKPTSN